jgi:DNA polymerase I
MEVELLPAVSLLPDTLSVLIAPEEMLARALNGNPHLQQFGIVFITGIRSGVLSLLGRSSMELDVRRAFTSVQLRTIMEENHHSILIVEHNPLLYERARVTAGSVALAPKVASTRRPRSWQTPGSRNETCWYASLGLIICSLSSRKN